MTTWGELRSYIRNSLLKDEKASRFSDASLLVYARWATQEISQHTAQCWSHEWQTDGVLRRFVLPKNIVGAVERTALIQHVKGTQVSVLVPYDLTPGMAFNATTEHKGFREWPSGSIELDFVPKADETLEMNYYRVWPVPTDDNFEIPFPVWMEHPFSYLVGAFALDPEGVQAALIRQWNTRLDSGNPEDNTLIQQSRYFTQQANRLLGLVSTQNREHWYANQ
jgi:hypothetical protein